MPEHSDSRCNSPRHHSFHDDYFGAQLFVDGKDVDQAQSKNHEVDGQDCTSCLIGVLHHPAETEALIPPPRGGLALSCRSKTLELLLPAHDSNNKQRDGDHVTFVPVVLDVELELL